MSLGTETPHVARTCTHRISAGTPRILCVDDDPDLQTSIELRMRKYNVEVEHAFYGMQGVVEAAQSNPDLILMDQAMPHGDGEYLLQAVKGDPATSSIPVIVLTGMRDPNLKNRLMQAARGRFCKNQFTSTN